MQLQKFDTEKNKANLNKNRGKYITEKSCLRGGTDIFSNVILKCLFSPPKKEEGHSEILLRLRPSNIRIGLTLRVFLQIINGGDYND